MLPRRNTRLAVLAGACGVLCASGCAHIHPVPPTRPTHLLSAEHRAYYDYPRQPAQAAVTLLEQRPRYRRHRVEFPSLHPIVEEHEVITLEWFETTRPGRSPAVLVYPILGGDYPLERGFCRYFAEHGFHAVLVYRAKFKFSRERGMEYLEGLLRQAVIKDRQTVDWLETLPQVDAGRLGAFGISMGGMNAVLTAAVEPRLRAHVIALAGGPLAEILRDTHDTVVTKPRTRYVSERGITLEQLHAEARAEVRSDPLALAPAVEASAVLMISAVFDRSIPRRNSDQLWEALGRPERLWLPLGHYTSYLLVPYVRAQALRFLRSRLNAVPSH